MELLTDTGNATYTDFNVVEHKITVIDGIMKKVIGRDPVALDELM